jgi:hypothetical protein
MRYELWFGYNLINKLVYDKKENMCIWKVLCLSFSCDENTIYDCIIVENSFGRYLLAVQT